MPDPKGLEQVLRAALVFELNTHLSPLVDHCVARCVARYGYHGSHVAGSEAHPGPGEPDCEHCQAYLRILSALEHEVALS